MYVYLCTLITTQHTTRNSAVFWVGARREGFAPKLETLRYRRSRKPSKEVNPPHYHFHGIAQQSHLVISASRWRLSKVSFEEITLGWATFCHGYNDEYFWRLIKWVFRDVLADSKKLTSTSSWGSHVECRWCIPRFESSPPLLTIIQEKEQEADRIQRATYRCHRANVFENVNFQRLKLLRPHSYRNQSQFYSISIFSFFLSRHFFSFSFSIQLET